MHITRKRKKDEIRGGRGKRSIQIESIEREIKKQRHKKKKNERERKSRKIK